MKKELSEKSRVAVLRMTVSVFLFVTGVMLVLSNTPDPGLGIVGMCFYLSSVIVFFSVDGKCKAIDEYRKFIKS